ncbi:MAG: protoporphyrinogen oxidase [Candidatus Acidiferrales bacterium]
MTLARKVAVVGGGISGLACALRLRELGVEPLLFESSDRPGGVIGSCLQNGFFFDSGPQSFLTTEPLLALIRAAGIENDLLRSDPKAPRFVLHRGKLQEIPLGPVPLMFTSLLGAASKLRLLSEPLRHTRPPTGEESIADFVRRKFGAEILDYLVAPFVSGVYAGDPEKLSLQSAFPSVSQWEHEYGSVLRGAIRSHPRPNQPKQALCSFRQGMGELPQAIAKSLGERVQCQARVEKISHARSNGSAEFELHVNIHGRTEALRTHAVVLAAPAYVTSPLLGAVGSEHLATAVGGIPYAPVAVVGGGYAREAVGNPLFGFGYLVPRKEKFRTLGTVWNSSLFPGRAPEGKVTLTSFAGGATDTELFDLEDNAIFALIEHEASKVLAISKPPVERFIRRYARALPQYNVGHESRIAAIRNEIARVPGLFITGNYLRGPSVGNCVELAFDTAEQASRYLSPIS